MAFAVEGFQTISQNWISKGIASNWYKKAPLLAILAAVSLSLGNQNKTDGLSIGRPGSAEILAGKKISPAEKHNLQGINSYIPRIQGFKTNNTAARSSASSGRTTAPTVANPTTNSHGQANQFGAKFNWTHIDTPILIWHEEKIRAGKKETAKGQGLAMAQVIDEATEVGMQDHVDWMADAVWNGNPSSQTADLWDKPLGLLQMISATNTYANVDRSQASNAVWRGLVDSTITSVDVRKVVDDANITKQLSAIGGGVGAILTTPAIYLLFKAQIIAAGGQICKEGMPEFAYMGVKKEVLMIDNAVIMWDEKCPANNVACLDLSVCKYLQDPAFNAVVSEFTDLSKAVEGGKFADQAQISSRFMITNDNPALSVLYTAIGT